MAKKDTVIFSSTGIVFGNDWGGGKGAYPARKLTADTKEDLIRQANEGLESGSLDSGMGYASLIGALLVIKTTTIKEIGGKKFRNDETEIEFIGDLTDDERDFLLDCEF